MDFKIAHQIPSREDSVPVHTENKVKDLCMQTFIVFVAHLISMYWMTTPMGFVLGFLIVSTSLTISHLADDYLSRNIFHHHEVKYLCRLHFCKCNEQGISNKTQLNGTCN